MREIKGGCHCRNIRFKFFWPSPDTNIPVRACGCSFCAKHRGTYTSHPQARLNVEITDDAHVRKYVFGTKTAEFHICSRCGVLASATSAIEGRDYAVVNVNAFENLDASALISSVSHFDGETTDLRLKRRKNTWIPDVRITHAAGATSNQA